MRTDENKARIIRIFEEGINHDDQTVFDELISPAYVNHAFPAAGSGPKGFEQSIAMFRGAFPDLNVAVEDAIAQDDRVATRGTMRGTHHGEFMGIPATGKQVEIGYIDIWRLEDGEAVENWVQMDMLGMMQQLGVVPTPERAEV